MQGLRPIWPASKHGSIARSRRLNSNPFSTGRADKRLHAFPKHDQREKIGLRIRAPDALASPPNVPFSAISCAAL